MPKKYFIFYIGGIFLFFLLVAMFNCSYSDDTENNGQDNYTVEITNLPGTWSGSWTDTIYNVGGNVSVTFTVSGDKVNATGSINLTQLGQGTLTGSGEGTIGDDKKVTFNFSASGLGSGNGALTGSSGSGNGDVTGPLSFGPFTFTGSISGNKMTGNFDFTNPGGGAGTGTLTKE